MTAGLFMEHLSLVLFVIAAVLYIICGVKIQQRRWDEAQSYLVWYFITIGCTIAAAVMSKI